MLSSGMSLLDLSSFSNTDILSFFEKVKELKANPGGQRLKKNAIVSLLFFENSTRTRVSFEMAAYRLGAHVSVLDANSGSSLAKGESEWDTVINVAAMNPELIVLRAGDHLNLQDLAAKVRLPIINAGWGQRGHPSQALLDLFTLWERRRLSKTRLLFLGDIRHSRVVASHLELCLKLGIEVAACGPEEFRPDIWPHTWFLDLESGLKFADVVMALRVQKERHSKVGVTVPMDTFSYGEQFGLRTDNMGALSSASFIMHPGPINYGVEMSEAVTHDERSLILQQVENGIYVRQALLSLALGED